MKVRDYIKIYDDFLPLPAIGSLIKFLNKQEFRVSTVVGAGNQGGVVNKQIRDVSEFDFKNASDSFTEIHWTNLLQKHFRDFLYRYSREMNLIDSPWKGISNITALRYKDKGHYKWHTDHCADVPRTFSMIFLLNDDYEGGELTFADPSGHNEMIVEKKAGRLILWPSNFMYPHKVQPIIKGMRYSIVAWAL